MKFNPLKDVVAFQLSNGLRVLLKEDHAWPLVSVHAWVHVGSVDEQAPQSGIAHILEHMLFKGTTHYNARSISRWVEMFGGGMNAETSKEYTHYYIDIPSAGTDKAVAIVGELLHQSLLDPDEWEHERPVILEELKRRNDDPEVMLWDLLNQALFQDEHLRRPVIGSPETVAAVSRDDLWRFYRDFYRVDGSLVVIAGDFKTAAMKKKLEAAFRAMPAGRGPRRPTPALVTYEAQHRALRRPVQQTYLAVGFPTPPSHHPDHEALDLLASILGDGRHSRLVHILRETKKIVWSVSAANYGHEGPGVFAVFADCSPARRHQVRGEVQKIMTSLRRTVPTASEIIRAKNLIQNGWLQGFETYHQQASILGMYALDEQLPHLEAYLPKLLALTPKDLKRVAETYFQESALSSAVIHA